MRIVLIMTSLSRRLCRAFTRSPWPHTQTCEDRIRATDDYAQHRIFDSRQPRRRPAPHRPLGGSLPDVGFIRVPALGANYLAVIEMGSQRNVLYRIVGMFQTSNMSNEKGWTRKGYGGVDRAVAVRTERKKRNTAMRKLLAHLALCGRSVARRLLERW